MNKIYRVQKYNYKFKGTITIDNNPFVIDNVLENELIEVNMDNIRKNEIKLIKVVEASKHRVKPPCSVYYKCGGCSLQHIAYPEQLRLKSENIQELFNKNFDQSYLVLPTIGMENPYHYRNKNQVVFKYNKGKISCGFYEEGSHNVIEFDQCYIQDLVSDRIIDTIKELVRKQRLSIYDEDRHHGLLRHVLIKISKASKEVMVVLITSTDVFPGRSNFVKALTARHKEITTVVQNINSRKTNAVLGDKEIVLFGKGYIHDVLLGFKFRIYPKSFYQINHEQTTKLYETAIKCADLSANDVLLDAYCGVGTIGMYASKSVYKVIGVEIVKEAIEAAISNAKNNNIKNISFFCDDASKFIVNASRQKQKIDVVIMDPPRKGSDEMFLNALKKLLPQKIIYISCNPYSQVEDIKKLIDYYDIKIIQPVDMFPHTAHIETVVLLSRKNNNSKVM